jgi:hypothetical protein
MTASLKTGLSQERLRALFLLLVGVECRTTTGNRWRTKLPLDSNFLGPVLTGYACLVLLAEAAKDHNIVGPVRD